jgi:hypothetical protein
MSGLQPISEGENGISEEADLVSPLPTSSMNDDINSYSHSDSGRSPFSLNINTHSPNMNTSILKRSTLPPLSLPPPQSSSDSISSPFPSSDTQSPNDNIEMSPDSPIHMGDLEEEEEPITFLMRFQYFQCQLLEFLDGHWVLPIIFFATMASLFIDDIRVASLPPSDDNVVFNISKF